MPKLFPIAMNGIAVPAQGVHNWTPTLYGSTLFILDPSSEQHMMGTPRTALQAKNAAVAAGASVTIQAATALIKLHVHSLVITVSVADEYQIIDNATIVGYFKLQANVPFTWPLPIVGYCQQAFNTALTIKNNGVGAADIFYSCLGNLLQ